MSQVPQILDTIPVRVRDSVSSTCKSLIKPMLAEIELFNAVHFAVLLQFCQTGEVKATSMTTEFILFPNHLIDLTFRKGVITLDEENGLTVFGKKMELFKHKAVRHDLYGKVIEGYQVEIYTRFVGRVRHFEMPEMG